MICEAQQHSLGIKYEIEKSLLTTTRVTKMKMTTTVAATAAAAITHKRKKWNNNHCAFTRCLKQEINSR
jgi:hypothetical protein